MASKIYFFKKDKYVQIDAESNKADPGYPRSIADDWNGLKEIGFDSDLNDAAYINGALYLFKNEKYVEYDLGNDKTKGGASPLSSLFKNVPSIMQSGFDACAYWKPGRFYIFKGNQSAECNPEKSPFTFGDAYDFSALQGHGWVAMPSSFKGGVDAGLTKFSSASLDSPVGTIFFKDSQMAVYTSLDGCSSAKAIQSFYHGLDGTDFANGIDAAVQLPTPKKTNGSSNGDNGGNCSTLKLAWKGEVPGNSENGKKTDLKLKKGDVLWVLAKGWIKYGDGNTEWSAPQSPIPPSVASHKSDIKGSLGSLVATIGDDKTRYPIGNGIGQWAAPTGGVLTFLFDDQPGKYANNSGSFEVTVWRETPVKP